MNTTQVCFVNTASKQERISVSDAASAEILKRLLAQFSTEKWEIEGEGALMPVNATARAEPADIQYIDARRLDERGAKEFRVILIAGDSTFRCGSFDVSLSGMRLKSSVPAQFTQTECLAYISHKDMRENIEVSCQVVIDQDGVSRIQILKAEKPELEKLSEWIAEEAL